MSQRLDLEIGRVEGVDPATKKKVIDTTSRGKIIVDFNAKTVLIAPRMIKNTMYISEFRSCEDKDILDDPNLCSYNLRNYESERPNNYIHFAYSADSRFKDKYDGLLIDYRAGNETYYYFNNPDTNSYKNYQMMTVENSFSNLKFDWILLNKNEGVLYFVKGDDFEKPNNTGVIKTWCKEVYEKKTINKVSYKNVVCKMQIVFDCKENKIMQNSYYYYSSSGKLLTSYVYDYPEWQEVVPESIGEAILKGVCELATKAH